MAVAVRAEEISVTCSWMKCRCRLRLTECVIGATIFVVPIGELRSELGQFVEIVTARAVSFGSQKVLAVGNNVVS